MDHQWRTMSFLDHNPQQSGGPDLQSMNVMLNRSKLFRAECKRLMVEADKAWIDMQNDTTKLLDQRVQDIQFMKKELELKLKEITVETDDLTSLQSRVVKALEACKEPLRVTVLCLEERRKRVPSERLHDEVDSELLREREVMKGAATLLQDAAEQITEQIRLNRSARYHLEQDLKDKSEALCIDCSATHPINNLQNSENTQTALPSLTLTPEQWRNMSDINRAKADQQKTNSMSLRALVESVLEQTATDMQKQVQATTTAFQLNIQEIKSAKSQMEDQLARIVSEYVSKQRGREDLQVAITEGVNKLSEAQAWLALRRQRPAREQCYDPAQAQVLAKVQQLNTHISKLHEAVAQSEEEQRAMCRCQLELQENIEIKANSLYIDEVICAQHREPIIIHHF